MPIETVKLLVDGGLTGIVIGQILLVIYLVSSYTKTLKEQSERYNKTMNNHLEHVSGALDRNTEVIGQASEVMRLNIKAADRVTTSLDRLHNNHDR